MTVVKENRISKVKYYFDIAKSVSTRSPCSRRKCGALLVKTDSIISTGYNGSVRDSINCGIEIPCIKDKHKEESLTSYVHCPAIHAEVNSIINSGRSGVSTIGSTLFLYSSITTDCGRPCIYCRRVIINAGVKDCYFGNENEIQHEEIQDWIKLENEWMKNE